MTRPPESGPLADAVTVPRMIAISSPGPLPPDEVVTWVSALAGAGVPAVQIRIRGTSDRELLRLLERIGGAAGSTRPLVNGRPDLALAVGWRGVHLPSRGLPVAAVRRLLGSGSLIGRSTHSRAEAEQAQAEGADYVLLGPVFDTPSKRRYGAPLGLDTLRSIVERLEIPVLAIGGIGAERFAAVAATGAHGIAAIRLFQDPRDAPACLDALAEAFGGR